MTHVPPDGPTPCQWMVVGEAPASEEVRQGRGFVGPSGALLWPLMWKLAGLNRADCYVTNLCKHPLDNDLSGDLKLSPAEFDVCAGELSTEIARVRPSRILAVGALAAKALIGDRYTRMDVCNGIGFGLGGTATVVPTWHPAAALRPGGEDKLAYTGAAIAALRHPKDHRAAPRVPDVRVLPADTDVSMWGSLLWRDDKAGEKLAFGIDTEGTPEAPICMTLASAAGPRWYVPRAGVRHFFERLPRSTVRFVFHNALWDWPVLWAMGAPRDLHTQWEWCDTMELAYLKQVEPRGLKDLAYRHLGLKMRSFEDVVMPHWEHALLEAASGIVAMGTTSITHSAKTGKLLKKPKVTMTPEAKSLHRAMGNPGLLAKRMPGFPPPNLDFVPKVEAQEYATLDAWATVMLEEHLRT